MELGAYMFSTDYSIRPDDLAKLLEDRGFESMWVPEHTHIPTNRVSRGAEALNSRRCTGTLTTPLWP
jgi:alkanesulfonate monooxygenase SsuD/methylene tetrahydromethanopterin reductase-like flavin-dependent oxidoreductase (luciferase family)